MEIFASRSNAVEAREVEHAQLASRLAGECVVLLENDGALPIAKSGKIALFGPGVRHTIRGGTGSGDVNVRSIVSIEEAFEKAGYQITSKAWLDAEDARLAQTKVDYAEFLKKEAERTGTPEFIVAFNEPYKEGAPVTVGREFCNSDADTAVYVISRNSGEGADRFNTEGDYLLSQSEIESIKTISAAYAKTILVLNIGGVMDLSPVKDMEGLNSILLMTQLGNLGGETLVDVLNGTVVPSGKTTDTWAKKYLDYPSSAKFSHNESVHDEDYEDGIYVGYRYFDSFGVEPLYPFGYGKSYTDFAVSLTGMKLEKDKAYVDASVTNTGKNYAGKEVLQVYVSKPDGKVAKPYQELVCYQKTGEIGPGASEKLTLSFPLEKLASYCEADAAWLIDAGKYVVRMGNSSADTVIAGVIEVKEEIIVEKTKNILALDKELKLIAPDADALAAKKLLGAENAEVFSLDKSVIETRTPSYQGKRQEYTTDKAETLTVSDVLAGRCTVEELTAQLTIEELAELCVGTQRTGDESIIGNASNGVPGAAGDTSPVIYASRGVRNLILADGPAGLRLQQHFKTDLEGNLLPGGEGLGDIIAPFDPKYDETNSIDYYQYCTAIPIGWALAQSWNEEIVEQAGKMVGTEMEQFGVDIWLAPALNIHRNPLCGRNFEYYSEDPLIAGKTAAAMTRGVQSHKGRGTCIKHYAANNQEDNRYFVNAHVSERTMREIYLKGFEICVRESQPLSLMTSYNLINGVHAANNHDTIQSALRDEWGFKGTVMTDWFTSQDIPALTGKFKPIYPISASTGCVYAGNDMQMPGCQKNVDDLVESATTGKEIDGYTVTKADLQYNAANVIRVVLQTM